jgi:hypothetical protein
MDKPASAAESSASIGLILAIVLAGVAGTIVNAIAAAIVIAPSRIRLALVPGRYVVAIAVAAVLPFIFRWARLSVATVLGWAMLTIVPSLLAKLYFKAPLQWPLVILLNAFYAAAAVIVYQRVVSRTVPNS